MVDLSRIVSAVQIDGVRLCAAHCRSLVGPTEIARSLDEVFSSDELNEFGQVNAVFNAWPYWRELVQSSLARMSMPILTVPVYRVLPSDPVKDDGE